MKKFTSFNSAPEHDNGKKKKLESLSKPTTRKANNVVVEDSSFGKRLDFSTTVSIKNIRPETTEKETEFKSSESLIRKCQEDFNRRLRKDPKNVSLWIEYIDFQDGNSGTTGIKLRKVTDRKISILKKAIDFNCENLELILMHLKLAEEIEDSCSLMKLWEGYLKKRDYFASSDYFKLTLEWLNFLQNTFLAFSFDQINSAFSEAFRKLQDPALYKPYFKFLRRCGFTEKIIAISQASIEVNVENYNYSEVDIEAYEDQWESGLMVHIGDSIFGGLSEPPLYPVDKGQNENSQLFKWLNVERYRENNFWRPSEFDLDDCEGQVIFDDIKDFILLPTDQNESLSVISCVLYELGNFISADGSCTLNNFKTWYIQIYKELLPFFTYNWNFIYRLLILMPLEEAKSFAMKFLSENRDSLECFMAYGKFQEFLGNTDMAAKVYESIKKRSTDFDFTEDLPQQFEIEKEIAIDIDTNLKSTVYDLVRSNPGNKHLYMKIIEFTAPVDEDLSMEVFDLIDEQQLRVYTLLEEIQFNKDS